MASRNIVSDTQEDSGEGEEPALSTAVDSIASANHKPIGKLVSLVKDVATLDISTLSGEILMGRNEACSCRFSDRKVSSKHCRIFVQRIDSGWEVVLEDLSANGTFLNGKKIGRGAFRTLEQGDKITFPCATDTAIAAFRYESILASTGSCASAAVPSSSPPASTPSSSSSVSNSADMGKLLECPICHDIFYQCVTCVPCMHHFCGACYSDWRKRSNTCPFCKTEVTEVQKDHVISSMAETYLVDNPAKKRSEEEYKDMDARNTVKAGTQTKRRRPYDDYDDDDEGDFSDDDDYEPITCRQCVAPGPDGYQCIPNATEHVRCLNCYQLFPKRPPQQPPLPPIQCDICKNYFCDMYWGCLAPMDPHPSIGSLKRLRDYDFDAMESSPNLSLITGTIGNGNTYEETVLRNWTQRPGASLSAAVRKVLDKLDDATLPQQLSHYGNAFQGTTVTCRSCTHQVLRKIMYEVRRSIPQEELPQEVASRADCWYGKNCRTQRHNPDHAKRLNHICEQTKRPAGQ
mmetsp:Transcript_10440/g.17073  ORF Transcript_10440/g.17073 Transcript_10440/m.17073 type:complete len:517 (+) Transcript_10440:42-1592(+)